MSHSQSSPAPSLSFAELLDTLPVEDFLSEFWEKKHLFIHRQSPMFHDALFSLADVDRWLSLARNSDRELLLVAPPESTLGVHRVRPRDVSIHEVYKAFGAGNTIVLEGIQEYWLPTAPLVDSMAEVFSAHITINLYLTPAGTQGVAVHPDMQDVFILQIEGCKDWSMYETTYPLPVESIHYWQQLNTPFRAAASSEPRLIDQARLERGDFLYIPRGAPHKAVSPDESPSLHLTVCVHPLFWVDLLKASIEALSVEEPSLRKALPPGFSSRADVRETIDEDFQQMLQMVFDRVSLEPALGAIVGAEVGAGEFPADGHFEQLARLGELTSDSLVERRRGLVARVETTADSASIYFARGSLRGPASLRPLLEFIRDRPRFHLEELPAGFSEQSKLTLVRRLIQAGLLRFA